MTEVKNKAVKKTALEALMGSTTEIEGAVHIPRLESDFTIKALTGSKINDLREQCTYWKKTGNKGKKEKVENTEQLGQLIVAEACVEPDFANDDLMKKFGAVSPGDCTQKALLAGEIAKISSAIMELSGFEDDENEVDAVKN